MLSRILTDNPGAPFTQNFDDKFVSTTKALLREGRDQSVQQILRETLDYFEAEKATSNPTLNGLMAMWRKEKGKGARFPAQGGPVVSSNVLATSDVFVPETHSGEGGTENGHRRADLFPSSQYPQRPPPQHRHQQSRAPRSLPPPVELAARIEEAKTTARLLIQTIQSTPQSELIGNELVKEFADRSKAAHKSIQQYMACENPAPDEDTMLTLIETNDQLNVAMSKHQRTLLQARKAMGVATPSPQPAPGQEANSYVMPQHTQGQNVYSNIGQPQQPAQNPYSSSPPQSPRRNGNIQAPAFPPREEQSFMPPPGPPPSQRAPLQNNTYEYEDAYSSGGRAPSVPARADQAEHPQQYQQQQQPFSPVSPVEAPPRGPPPTSTATAAYGVNENPFADDAYAAPAASGGVAENEPPPPKQYSLFDRAKHHITNKPPNPNEEKDQTK
jgi:hypothetical protein